MRTTRTAHSMHTRTTFTLGWAPILQELEVISLDTLELLQMQHLLANPAAPGTLPFRQCVPFFQCVCVWVTKAWCRHNASLSNSCTGQLMRAVVLCRGEFGDNGFRCVFMQAILLQSVPAWAPSTTMKAAMEPIQFTESTANPRSPTSRAYHASNEPVGNNTPAPSVPAGAAPWYTLRGYCTYFDVDTGVRVYVDTSR